ncbi:MAG: hypothetical protein LC104_17275 [Bacteroidales bacterium]|nr:hypothetical protein [Bacteroidales bacterium]
MTDTPLPPASAPQPAPAASVNSGNLGFLSIFQDVGGVLGGYLVTNTWGRPLEFRLSSAVQPNKVQQILYGPTLSEYLHTELIGKTLIEKTATQPGLVIVDSLAALGLRAQINIPVVGLAPEHPGSADPLAALPADVIGFTHPRSSVPLVLSAKFAHDRPEIEAALDKVDQSVDLSEPFVRVREAVSEARKMGVANRAA